MSGEATTQKLTKRQHDAALLVAEDEVSDRDIAERIGVSRFTLYAWQKKPEFAQLVGDIRAEFRQRVLTLGFADKTKRVKALNALATAVLVELSKAGDDDEPQGMYRLEKKISANGEIVEQEVFDKPKADTFRGYLDDIAKELGERRAGLDVKHTHEVRKEAERLAGLYGVPIEQAERDILLRVEASR